MKKTKKTKEYEIISKEAGYKNLKRKTTAKQNCQMGNQEKNKGFLLGLIYL